MTHPKAAVVRSRWPVDAKRRTSLFSAVLVGMLAILPQAHASGEGEADSSNVFGQNLELAAPPAHAISRLHRHSVVRRPVYAGRYVGRPHPQPVYRWSQWWPRAYWPAPNMSAELHALAMALHGYANSWSLRPLRSAFRYHHRPLAEKKRSVGLRIAPALSEREKEDLFRGFATWEHERQARK